MINRSMFNHLSSAGRTVTLPITSTVSMQMIWCPSGEFFMGSAEDDEMAAATERPRHRVKLGRGFLMARTHVTQLQWEAVMKQKLPLFDKSAEGDLLPAEGMAWDAARDFCDRLTSMLQTQGVVEGAQRVDMPTEAQWEYACRAGTTTRWYFGDDPTKLNEHAWYRENSNGTPHAVALKNPNPWGLHDLYGNVTEWCKDDFYLYSSAEDVQDPLNLNDPGGLKMTRGGSFSHGARECRSAKRESVLVDNPFNESTGLRVIIAN